MSVTFADRNATAMETIAAAWNSLMIAHTSANIWRNRKMNTMTDLEQQEFMPISVRFKMGIRTDSAIYFVTVEQGDNCVILTERQALALANQIEKRAARAVQAERP